MATIDTGNSATLIEDPNSVRIQYHNVNSWQQYGEYINKWGQAQNLFTKVTGEIAEILHDPRIKEEAPKKRGPKPKTENKSANETE